MSRIVKLDADRAALIEALWRLSPEEIQAIARYVKLRRLEAVRAECDDFAEHVSKRNTGLSIAELTAFCDKIESKIW